MVVLERQHEVVCNADVNWLERGVGEVQLLEWKLNVCEGQLGERRLTHAGKRDE